VIEAVLRLLAGGGGLLIGYALLVPVICRRQTR